MEGKQALLSIIIPVYKVEKYLDKCVSSVVEQTYSNLEIVLVDDGSPDQCGKKCDEWAQKDQRIKVIHKENGGQGDARNVALDIATGEYIGFVDSDDYIHPDMYQTLYQYIEQYHADISVCGYAKVDEAGQMIPNTGVCPSVNGIIQVPDTLKKIGTVSSVIWNKLYRRALWESVRFPLRKLYEDEFVIHQLLYLSKKTVTVAKRLYYYVQRPQSTINKEMTIKNLDGIEAYYERILFYEQKGLFSFIPDLTYSMFFHYLTIRDQIKIKNRLEKRRVKEIKKMIKVCFDKYGQKIGRLHIIFLVFPQTHKLLRRIRSLNFF